MYDDSNYMVNLNYIILYIKDKPGCVLCDFQIIVSPYRYFV